MKEIIEIIFSIAMIVIAALLIASMYLEKKWTASLGLILTGLGTIYTILVIS